jgi:hypothetical protein
MEILNHTKFHAIVQVAELPGKPLAGVVIVKASYDFDEQGRLSPSEEVLALVPNPLETPFGALHGELFFKKRGVDLCVLGTVTRSRPVSVARLCLRVGAQWTHEMVVHGDRVWLPDASGNLIPSEPIPFTRMPLGYMYAYGGNCDHEGMTPPYPDNPVGRGYFIDAEHARLHHLPNIEMATGPFMTHWSEEAPVAGWGPYPNYWRLRAAASITLDEKGVIEHIDCSLFNHAHPDLIFAELPPGTPIIVEGLHESTISIRAPCPPAKVAIRLGGDLRSIEAPVDGVFIWADVGKLVVTQRARFEYEFEPRQLRQAVVDMA